jgi:hypothetical protein
MASASDRARRAVKHREVVMVDLGLGVLHRPGSVHLRTACGHDLTVATVGPRHIVERRAESRCERCFPKADLDVAYVCGEISREEWQGRPRASG